MLTYRTAAAGAPAAARAMVDHLREQTLDDVRSALAEYYTRSLGASEEVGVAVRALTEAVAEGKTTFPAAIERALAAAGDEARQKGTAAIPRPDMHPAVAEALGIDPSRTVTNDELANLFSGQRSDGARLPGAVRDIAFIDLCFSADKSVSLAWAFAPTEAERASILQAHMDAVDTTMRYVASEIGRARRGKAGQKGAEPGHVGWVSFTHYTSRPTMEIPAVDPVTGEAYTELLTVKAAGDPNLHTHNPMFNLVATDSGHMGSLDLKRLRGRIEEFGAFYQANLATNLRRVGVAVVLDRKTGAARLSSIPTHVRSHFSKRTADALTAAREWAASMGVDWDSLTDPERIDRLKGGAKASRKSKADDLSDFGAWWKQAKGLAWVHKGAVGKVRPQEPSPDLAERVAVAAEAGMPFLEAFLGLRAVLRGTDARIAAVRGLIASGTLGPADISAVTKAFRDYGVRQEGQLTSLVWAKDADGEVKVSTHLHMTQEEELVALMREGVADKRGMPDLASLQASIERSHLDFTTPHGQTQRAIIEGTAEAGRLVLIEGAAGAGKSAILGPIADAHVQAGGTLYGTAVAWRMASSLLGDAGVPPGRDMALVPFLLRARMGKLDLGPNTMVLVDEAALLGTRQGLALLRLQKQHGFRIVGVGDDKQGISIEAGSFYTLYRRALSGEQMPAIRTTIRQVDDREKELAGLFREGRAAEAIDAKRAQGDAIAVPGGFQEAVVAAAKLWRERYEVLGRVPGLVAGSAPTNAGAQAFAQAIRAERRAMGEIGRKERVVPVSDQRGERYEMRLSVGDRIRIFDRISVRMTSGRWGSIGDNGAVLEVLGVSRVGLRVKNRHGSVADVPWDSFRGRDKEGPIRMAYGDVLTIDSVQGSTAAEFIGLMPRGSREVNGRRGYVEGSRHRHRYWMVTSDGAERREIAERRPMNDARPITADDVWANVARNLSVFLEKETTLDFLDRARTVERAAAHALQAGARAVEARAVAGRPLSVVAATRELRRAQAALVRVAERIQQAGRQIVQQSSAVRSEAVPIEPAPRPVPASTPPVADPAPAPPRPVPPKSEAYPVETIHQPAPRRLAPAPKPEKSQSELIQDFTDACRNLGLKVPGNAIMDGNRHYVQVDGDKKGEKRGTYIGHLTNGLPRGFIGNHRTKETYRWKADAPGRYMSPAERAAAEKAAAEAAAKREADRHRKEDRAAVEALRRWDAAKPATADQPYLAKKGVQPHGTRVDADGNLLVPLRDVLGQLRNIQTIYREGHTVQTRDGPAVYSLGDKRPMTGAQKNATFFVLGTLEPGKPFWIVEGFATGATVREATGLPVVVAIDTSNVGYVAEVLRKRDPEAPIFFAADNDRHLPLRTPPLENAGIKAAEAAARDVGGLVVAPKFSSTEQGTDWNDVHALHGLAAVRERMRAGLVEARAQARGQAETQDQRQGVSQGM